MASSGRASGPLVSFPHDLNASSNSAESVACMSNCSMKEAVVTELVEGKDCFAYIPTKPNPGFNNLFCALCCSPLRVFCCRKDSNILVRQIRDVGVERSICRKDKFSCYVFHCCMYQPRKKVATQPKVPRLAGLGNERLHRAKGEDEHVLAHSSTTSNFPPNVLIQFSTA